MSMRRPAEVLFGAVCLLCCAALIALSLLGAVHLARLNDEAAALEKEILTLREENAHARAVYESSLDLHEIERRAEQELGLQHRRGGQVEELK